MAMTKTPKMTTKIDIDISSSILLLLLYSEHGEVVALLRITHELCDGGAHGSDEFLRVVASSLRRLHHPIHFELLVVDVLGLVQTVSIEEEGGTAFQLYLLTAEFPFRENTCRDVRIAWQQTDLAVCQQQRLVVAGIAVVHVARFQINHTHEEGNEHAGLVVVAQRIVDAHHHLLRLGGVGCDIP